MLLAMKPPLSSKGDRTSLTNDGYPTNDSHARGDGPMNMDGTNHDDSRPGSNPTLKTDKDEGCHPYADPMDDA